MKSIMLSIKPKYVALIANGKKTIEVRKTRPKIDTPFKCYIYETKSYDTLFGKGKPEKLWVGGGRVIGEFVCDKIYDITPHFDTPTFPNQYICDWDYGKEFDCLSFEELTSYLNGKQGYAWHISDLVIYDKPRDIGEFESAFHCFNLENVEVVENAFGDYVVKYWDNSFCRICKYYNGDFGDCDKRAYQPLTRPPQSWCYIEEKENENE